MANRFAARSVGIDAPRRADGDLTLIDAARLDRAAFGPLYQRYADRVYRYCFRRLGRPDLAADATGQVFAKALAGVDGFRGGSFRAWLFTIAHNVVMDELRQQRADLQPLDAALGIRDGSMAAAPEAAALAAEQRRALWAALAQLPEDQRQIVELRLAGLTGPEIGEVLGRSPAAIKSSQFRAYQRLRQLLQEDLDERFGGDEP